MSIWYYKYMGFFDDLGLNEFLDDVRAAGEEFEALKDDVVSSVIEMGRELSGDEVSTSTADDEATT